MKTEKEYYDMMIITNALWCIVVAIMVLTYICEQEGWMQILIKKCLE